METRGMEKIITVDENSNSAAVAQLPGNIIVRIEIVHLLTNLEKGCTISLRCVVAGRWSSGKSRMLDVITGKAQPQSLRLE